MGSTTAVPIGGRTRGGEHPAVIAFDCTQPATVAEIDAGAGCKGASPSRGTPQEIWLLQWAQTHSYQGYRCATTKNEESHICGLWSYEKALTASMGQIPMMLTGEDCERLVRTKRFTDDSTRRVQHDIDVPRTTVFS